MCKQCEETMKCGGCLLGKAFTSCMEEPVDARLTSIWTLFPDLKLLYKLEY